MDVATRGREQVGGLLGRERPLNEESRETQQLDDVVDGVADQEGNDEQNQRNDERAANGLALLSRCLRVRERNSNNEIACCTLHEKKDNGHDNDGNIHRHHGPHGVCNRKSDVNGELPNQNA